MDTLNSPAIYFSEKCMVSHDFRYAGGWNFGSIFNSDFLIAEV